MKLGLNSVLFGAWDMETAFKYTAMAGYDGIEVSAIGGMSQHLVLDNWRETAGKPSVWDVNTASNSSPWNNPGKIRHHGKSISSCKRSRHPRRQLRSGWKIRRRRNLPAKHRLLSNLANRAETYGVTLCVKAHVGAASTTPQPPCGRWKPSHLRLWH